MTASATRIRTGRGRRWTMAAACLAAVLLVALLAAPSAAESAGSAPVARAVLFYSPTCEHCRELIREGLPPVLSRYGDRLQLLAVDASREPGAGLFRRAVDSYEVPAARRGVPAVVIGDRFLAGTTDIGAEPGRERGQRLEVERSRARDRGRPRRGTGCCGGDGVRDVGTTDGRHRPSHGQCQLSRPCGVQHPASEELGVEAGPHHHRLWAGLGESEFGVGVDRGVAEGRIGVGILRAQEHDP